MARVLGNAVSYRVDKRGVFNDTTLRTFYIDINNNKCLLGLLFYSINRNKKGLYKPILIVHSTVFFIFVTFRVYRNSLRLYGLINN